MGISCMEREKDMLTSLRLGLWLGRVQSCACQLEIARFPTRYKVATPIKPKPVSILPSLSLSLDLSLSLSWLQNVLKYA